MTYKYGFELEGFWQVEGNIVVPPTNYPKDGFAGLIEFRTSGGGSLKKAFADLLEHMFSYDLSKFITNKCVHTFTPDQKRSIRKFGGNKTPCDIRNLYSKKPKSLGGKTIASFQISISNETSSFYRDNTGKDHPATYTLFDVPRIVKALDNEFLLEIKDSGRQTGEYCIKGDRLEYRSLPNTVFPSKLTEYKAFLDRIKKAVEG